MLRHWLLLLTFLATATLFIVSFICGFALAWTDVRRAPGGLRIEGLTVDCAWGRLWIESDRVQVPVPASTLAATEKKLKNRYPPFQFRIRKPIFGGETPGVAGIGYYYRAMSGGKLLGVAVPLWLVPMLCCFPALRWGMRRWVAADRARRGLCPSCGYDLRSSAGRCPECGVAPKATTLAPDCKPAVVAVARSTGTRCVAILAAYFTIAIMVLAQVPEMSSVSVLVVESALITGILLVGVFHAAGYSRSPQAFFAFGCLGALLLFPSYLAAHRGRFLSLMGETIICLSIVVAIGGTARLVARARWTIQDRTD